MATVQFSKGAKSDLLRIGAFTLENWGAAQAERYLDGLEQRAKMLAGSPALGRDCAWIRPGLRRFEKGRHVVFYRQTVDGILISRILHRAMLPDEHGFDSEDDRFTGAE
ncbi:MAG: type II toxin-antitoxin system RelE/ParE family toxin [Terracidiphilus sp.]